MAEKRSLYIKQVVDGTEGVPFPSEGAQAVIGTFTYEATRMGTAPTIEATLEYPRCLDGEWHKKVYVEFRGEKYYVLQVPTSKKENDSHLYSHDVTFVSQRICLENVYFYDVVSPLSEPNETDEATCYRSNSSSLTFYGDISEFVGRLNDSLIYSGLAEYDEDEGEITGGYYVVIDDGITSETVLVSFEDKYIAEALQEIYNTYELSYYFVGKVCHVGYSENVITTPLEYRAGLLTIERENTGEKAINKVTGTGGSDNIPYYYPNDDSVGTVPYASTLMPSVYRSSLGTERYYKAYNNTYTDADGNYVEFANEYDADDPREAVVSFDDIHPTIKGVTNSSGQLFGEIADIAFDDNDNDLLVSGDSEYVHSYFYIKLHKFDGDFGFNLFEQATEDDTAKVCLTSGNCSACEFEIGVYKRESGTGNYVFDNPVQVDSNGDIVAGDYIVGSVYEKVCQENGNYQDSQQDTTANEVWIALKKENSTFGVVMPNATNNYRPSVGDTFVITGIKMPQSLVEAAEAELDSELIAYMKENNEEKFTYNVTLSRIWLARNEEIADLLNENARLIIVYNDIEHQLYVSGYTCKADGNILYEVTVELTEEVTVATSSLTQQLGEVESHILAAVSSADFISSGLKYFLRKDTSDTARGLITFLKGLKVGTFVSGSSGAYIDSDGDTEIESLLVRAAAKILGGLETTSITNSGDIVTKNLTVTGKATFFELVIDKIKAAGGAVLFTPADGFEVEEVEYDEDANAYTLRWKATDGEKQIVNMWEAGDQAICQTFNAAEGTSYNVSNKLWWALVTGAGQVTDDEGTAWNYIVVDFDDVSDNTGDSVPEVGDAVAMLGSRSEDTTRQSAVYISAYASLDTGLTAPLIATYRGIDDYDLESHRFFKSDAVGVTIKGELISTSGGNEYPVKVSMGEWDEDTAYSYYNEVTYNGGTYLCISHDGCQGVEPGTDGAVWLCTEEPDPVYIDVLVDGVSMNYMEMAYGESITIECKLMRGWKEYSGSVDSWSITRDSGDEADDAAWQLRDKAQDFDGSITLCYGPDENDLPSDTAKVSATFTVTASNGGASLATVEITI